MLPEVDIVNLFLANSLSDQASFLLNQGFEPRLSQLVTALDYELWDFAIEFTQCFTQRVNLN